MSKAIGFESVLKVLLGQLGFIDPSRRTPADELYMAKIGYVCEYSLHPALESLNPLTGCLIPAGSPRALRHRLHQQD